MSNNLFEAVAPMMTTRPKINPTPTPRPAIKVRRDNEAVFIHDTLRIKYGVPVRVAAAVPTPDYFCYMLEAEPGYAIRATEIERVLRDLQIEIYDFRGRKGDPIAISFVDQPPHIQVSKAEREILKFSLCPKPTKDFTVSLGAFWTGPQPQTVKINLLDEDEFNILSVGTSGSGKSSVLWTVMFQLLGTVSPDRMEVYLIDTHSNSFDILGDLPHVKAIARTDAEAATLIRHLRKLAEDDRELNGSVRRLIVIDEAHLIFQFSKYAEQVAQDLTVLATTGRKKGYNLMIAVQDPKGENLPMTIQRQMASKVVVSGINSDEGYTKRYLGIAGTTALRGKGDMIIKTPKGQRRFKAFFVYEGFEKFVTDWDDDQQVKLAKIKVLQNRANALVRQWGKDSTLIEFIDNRKKGRTDGERANVPANNMANSTRTSAVRTYEQVEPLALPTQTVDRVTADAGKVMPYLDQIMTEAGKFRTEFTKSIIELLYGEAKPSEGNYRKRAIQAVQRAWEMHQANDEPNGKPM